MSNKHLSRREFLRLGALAAAGLTAASCGAGATEAPPPATEAIATTAPATAVPPAAKEVTLDVMSLAEYENVYKEIWSVFESQNPGIKIQVFSVNEDTAAAHEAKVAGGYLPAIEDTQELQIFFNKDNYQLAIDLSSFDFDWWDRFTFDFKNGWSDLYKLPGPRSLDIFQGVSFTWAWNADLMAKAGFDPVKDVKTYADMEKWLDEGTAWAKTQPDIERFWNTAWHNWGYWHFMENWPLSWQDGSRQRQADCYMGKAKFNAEDSPYRHGFEFYKKAFEKGWIPDNFFTRQWEADQEASYIGGKTVMCYHGPWLFDKADAAGVNFKHGGMPNTPPADGGQWLQYAIPPNVDNQWFIRTGNEKQEWWEQTKFAWNWYHSPEAIKMRSEAEGRAVLYKLEEPLDIKAPQYQLIMKEIEAPGGKFENVKYENTLTGAVLAGPYRKKGSKGVWDWEANGNNQLVKDAVTGAITIQQALDILQKNWEESYEGLPAA